MRKRKAKRRTREEIIKDRSTADERIGCAVKTGLGFLLMVAEVYGPDGKRPGPLG